METRTQASKGRDQMDYRITAIEEKIKDIKVAQDTDRKTAEERQKYNLELINGVRENNRELKGDIRVLNLKLDAIEEQGRANYETLNKFIEATNKDKHEAAKNIKRTAVNTAVSTVVGAAVGGIIAVIIFLVRSGKV